MEILESLVQLDQDDPAARRKLARLKLAAGEPANARKWAEDSLLIDVTSVETQELRGLACLKLEDWSTAAKSFATALEIEPDRLSSQLGLIEAQVRLGQKDEASKLLEIVQQAHPEEATVKELQGRLGL
jgi:tetratricopeptide (TPR) repeat protein